MTAQHSRETQDYGTWTLDFAGERGGGAQLTVHNRGLVLRPALTLDSAIGLARAAPEPQTAGSYRLSLPTTLLYGITGLLLADEGEFAFAVGAPALSRFRAVPTAAVGDGVVFTGHLASRALAERLSLHWAAARAVPGVPDHATLGFAFTPQVRNGKLLAQALVNYRGQWGASVDADLQVDELRFRAGGYQLEQGLRWGDAGLPDDQQGVFARAERRDRQSNSLLSVDASRNNPQGHPDRAQSRTLSAYGNHSLRIDRATTLSVVAAHTQSRSLGSGEQTRAQSRESNVGGTLSLRSAVGTTLAEIYLGRLNRAATHRYAVSHQHSAQHFGAINFGVAGQRDGAVQRRSVSAGGRYDGQADWSVDLAATWVQTRTALGSSRDINYNFQLNWQLAAAWSLQGEVVVNRVGARLAGVGLPATPLPRDQRVLLNLRYAAADGVPFPRLGASAVGERAANSFGSGVISGVVFFDQNGDGLRQAHEPGAGNVRVVLEGRHVQPTDKEGRFEFRGVAIGARRLSLQADRLPLPWAAPEGVALTVNVPLRGVAQAEIPLTRFAE
jgi:hypothetical protein